MNLSKTKTFLFNSVKNLLTSWKSIVKNQSIVETVWLEKSVNHQIEFTRWHQIGHVGINIRKAKFSDQTVDDPENLHRDYIYQTFDIITSSTEFHHSTESKVDLPVCTI